MPKTRKGWLKTAAIAALVSLLLWFPPTMALANYILRFGLGVWIAVRYIALILALASLFIYFWTGFDSRNK